ncbi:PTS sugar transporter subunit IIB [Niallia sp. JL1B1071]|uniref:PTS sugar transporter subunit IIB n=1 Tax=Bacillaceae TaxID=186817 RepID=UPI0004E17828|nr:MULTISPECIES: PTS sugar transporter subunit IIB [Bacillaceae]MCF2647818.1 PTS sugar transporter subunit IIB [Niallia circulans]CAI9388224.1 PTS system galactitol-specific EIIB component [Bacillus sp. T2.9-1]
MKKILIACGAGIATSTVALNKLQDALKERGLLNQVTLHQTTVAELASKANEYDLIVTTTNFTKELNIPVVKGLSFITNVGKEKTIEEVITKLGLK